MKLVFSMEKYIYFMCNKDVTLVLTDDYYFYFGLKAVNWTTSGLYYV